MSVTGTADTPIIGVTRPDMTSSDIKGCRLSSAPIASLLAFLSGFITRHDLHPYDIRARHGELKFLIVMTTANNDQGILRFVLKSSEVVPRIRKALPELLIAFPWLKVISCNIQPIPAAILEGPEEIVLTDCAAIRDDVAGVPLYFAPQSFMQVTPSIAKRLYRAAADVVIESRAQDVLDLFCGVGGFSLSCADVCGSITGIEISKQAIECATKSAAEMGLKNTRFISADVDKFLSGRSTLSPDLVITNPPRRGLSDNIVGYLLQAAPKKIVYSSCNPETFCRDVAMLAERYSLDSVTPFDMFPLTNHWEILGVLGKAGKTPPYCESGS